MKQILITITFIVMVLGTVSAQSPFILDKFGNPQPFSLNSPYWDEIRPDTLTPNYVTDSYNNDSLLWEYNDPKIVEKYGKLINGMIIDSTHYSFKKLATHFDVGHGDIWLLKVTSPTSAGLAVELAQFDLPQGALISFYRIEQTGRFTDHPYTFANSNFNKFLLWCIKDGKELYVEYYQPKSLVDSFDISIKSISYYFSDGIFATMPEPPKKKDELKLKSGYWGWSTIADNCGTKIPCSGTENWKKDGKSVIFIKIQTSNVIGRGTGFFINKGMGYLSENQPYIITSGHLFSGVNNEDLRNSIVLKEVYVNYEDQLCDDSFSRKGSLVDGFGIISVGNSFNKIGLNNYIVNEDFALLQSDRTIQELAVHNVLYAGWDRYFNYEGNSGYAYIGHPNYDVKSVNTYSSYGIEDSLGRFFKIYNGTGINEKGFSGSPVFCGNPASGSVEAVGWAVQTGIGNFSCGDENQVTQCGMFSALFSNMDVQNNLNPTSKFSQESSQPTTEALPNHCSDCLHNYDEDDIDCGGSCQPCGMADDLTISSAGDIAEKTNINARFNLTVNGSSAPVCFKSQSYTLTAGESLKLKNTKVSDGATFLASVNEEQKYADAQGCQAACIDVANIFTPNGDGIHDFLIARFAFVKSYSVMIRDGDYNNVVYSSSNNYVYENGIVTLWDGDGSVNGKVYLIYLNTIDCYGNSSGWEYVGFAHCYKSAYINYESGEGLSDPGEELFLIYPNPATQEIKVSVNGDCFNDHYNISIYDSSGKKIKTTQATGNYNILSISDIVSGTYVISIETDKKTFSKKFVKK